MVNGYNPINGSGWGASSYASNYLVFGTGRDTSHGWGTRYIAQYNLGNLPDGTSNTVGFAEKMAACLNTSPGHGGTLWAHPSGDWGWQWGPTFANSVSAGDANGVNWNQPPMIQPIPWQTQCDRSRPSTGHPGAAQTGMMDASVRGVTGTVTQVTWQIAIQPDDGLVLPNNW